jgi:cytochrome c peroxidase
VSAAGALRSSLGAALLAAGLLACGPSESPPPAEPTPEPETAAPAASPREALLERARAIFAPLPDEATSASNPVTDEKALLGRLLFFDPRLSKNHDVSCNTCHDLARYGVDGLPTSVGHGRQRGDRNAPTVYNAAFHLAQFWDGRAADVEEQAAGPMANPVEMALPQAADAEAVLASIPDYDPLFRDAFPGDPQPITLANATRAIGAFERRLTTPSRFDQFLAGDAEALAESEVEGLRVFMDVGCASCHNGVGVGGGSFQKLGAVEPYATQDPGRFRVTAQEADRQVFKVPSLRNASETAPYFHDGSIPTLEQAIRLMGRHQLGRTLSDEQVGAIAAFVQALRGGINPVYILPPELPASGPDTPAPDPS